MVNYITSCYIQSYFDRLDPLNLRKRNKGIPCTKIECEKMYRDGLKDVVVDDVPMNLKNEKNVPMNIGVTPHTQAIRRLHADILKATSLLKEFPCLQKIPWNICMFDRGEFPYPHTHGDTIFLHVSMFTSYNAYPEAFYSVLIHEKIHIFQRLYPLETYAYIRNVLGCDITNKRDPNPNPNPDESTTEYAESMSTRMNPDTNALTYCMRSRKREDSEIRARWKTVNGDSAEIVDVRDHPFEMMAYRLTDTLLGRRNKYGGKMTNRKDEETWIKTYLEE